MPSVKQEGNSLSFDTKTPVVDANEIAKVKEEQERLAQEKEIQIAQEMARSAQALLEAEEENLHNLILAEVMEHYRATSYLRETAYTQERAARTGHEWIGELIQTITPINGRVIPDHDEEFHKVMIRVASFALSALQMNHMNSHDLNTKHVYNETLGKIEHE